MTIYVGFLRGINVGGNNKIKMADLKHMLESLGFTRVQTYIQSGNVVFEAEEAGEQLLQAQIEAEISKVFGMSISVMLRTAEELEHIIETCPFSPDSLSAGESIHLTLLKDAPSREELDKLPDVAQGNDEYFLEGRELYLMLRQSILDSKLPKKYQKLSPQTSRNWKTIMKLYAMVQAMEPRG
ncbi:DUF1697 domain-containing protein [Tumebacillus permanentifrigoris]|uniref:Uncharacterized protein (DUF1697 family) n=1 Tax=Tumebacillus permanentifrigoris TaxID=378543 RepID=A0A316DAM8_9BACL|nr:DUF1697 domain-containing protein [Tumebacillus permanentifrigoris]PWK14852.1 uncharacterized protein (DUF1697 family) [Tumebacillus permanentifrigoris]